MKRIPIAAALLAATTPALAQNTKTENDVAGPAVMFMTSDKCGLSREETTRFKAIVDRIIEANGWTWEQLHTGKPIVGHYLKDHPVYESMEAGDKVAIDSMCGPLREALKSGALK
jgi:hypothetical protein